MQKFSNFFWEFPACGYIRCSTWFLPDSKYVIFLLVTIICTMLWSTNVLIGSCRSSNDVNREWRYCSCYVRLLHPLRFTFLSKLLDVTILNYDVIAQFHNCRPYFVSEASVISLEGLRRSSKPQGRRSRNHSVEENDQNDEKADDESRRR